MTVTFQTEWMVAAARDVTLAEYISGILRPIVHRDLEEESRKMLATEEQTASKRKGGAK
jgi:hypothetical protein